MLLYNMSSLSPGINDMVTSSLQGVTYPAPLPTATYNKLDV